MSSYHRFLLLVMIMQVLMLLLMNQGVAQTQSVPKDEILPFHVMKAKPDSGNQYFDGYPSNTAKMVEFPAIPALKGVTLFAYDIDYESHILGTYDPKGCLPRLYLQLHNLPIDPFQFYPVQPEFFKTPTNLTFFDCSSVGSRYLKNEYSSSSDAQDMFVCPIYAVDSNDSILKWDLVSCTVMDQFLSPIPAGDLQTNNLRLKWSQAKSDVSKRSRIVLPTTASIILALLLLLLIIACFRIYCYFKMKGDDQTRLEKFLEDYRALKPTRFSYADLKRITNNFKEKLGEGAHGAVFKGKLSSEIPVAVKVLNNSDDDGKSFINEVGTMGKIHHINVVRLLGFCADGFHRALVYDFFPNGSLQKFIASPDNKDTFLGWSKLQQIALGTAKGIEYLHQGCECQILHFDINPYNVLLDDNFNPKISDFGLAKLCSKNQNTVSMTAAKGTLGYIAPEVFSRKFGSVSYKSDVYSYGMLLLEMVGGRKNIDTNCDSFQVLYPEWIHNLIEGRDINMLTEDEDIRIAKKLSIVGFWCIQWHPINRPSMKTVIQMLEGEADKLKVPPTLSDASTSTNTSTIAPRRRLNLELEVIREME